MSIQSQIMRGGMYTQGEEQEARKLRVTLTKLGLDDFDEFIEFTFTGNGIIMIDE